MDTNTKQKTVPQTVPRGSIPMPGWKLEVHVTLHGRLGGLRWSLDILDVGGCGFRAFIAHFIPHFIASFVPPCDEVTKCRIKAHALSGWSG
jgi:hypothetical protein